MKMRFFPQVTEFAISIVLLAAVIAAREGAAKSLSEDLQLERISSDIVENSFGLYKIKRDIRSIKVQDPETQLELIHHRYRHRRGLGNWLKKVLHIKTTPKTTTTTPRPSPHRSTAPPPEPSYSSEEARKSLFRSDFPDGDSAPSRNSRPEPAKVSYVADQHGDTEIDWLLPTSLRKSSIKGSSSKTEPPANTPQQEQPAPSAAISVNKPGAEPEYRRRSHRHRSHRYSEDYESASREPSGRKSKHHSKSSYGSPSKAKPRKPSYESSSVDSSEEKWKRIFNSFEADEVERAPGLPKRSKRSLRKKKQTMTLPKSPITNINVFENPVETASKEELRLLHELFINIVNGRCPKSLKSSFVDDVELNLFRIIESSPWEDTQEETSPEITTLIHQLVNCSIASEAEKDLLQMFLYQETHFHSPSHDLELGAPVSRSKRGRMHERKDAHSTSSRKSPESMIMSNFEFSLISFISNECKNHVTQPLLHSASQLILETIQKHFRPFIPISERSLEENLNILQFCAGVIMKHREKEMRLKRKLQDNFRNYPVFISSLPLDAETAPISRDPRQSKTGEGKVKVEKVYSGNEALSPIFHDIPFVESLWKTRE